VPSSKLSEAELGFFKWSKWSRDAAPSLRRGDVIADEWVVTDTFEGAFGAVHLCTDKATKARAAFKTIRYQWLENEALRLRFLEEARRWIALGGRPHIVQAWSVEEISHIPFILIECVDGHRRFGNNLAQWIARKKLNWRDAISFGVQLSAGMRDAYQAQELIHCDLKPSNLLITEDGTLKITDFGLSFAASEGAAGNFGGTPEYMAPEQWYGGEIGTCTDIYAAGLILYEVATGQPAFPRSADRAKQANYHLQATPPDPRQAVEIPDGLAELILQCLAKRPRQRPDSFEELFGRLADLHRTLIGGPLPVSSRVAGLLPLGGLLVNQINSLSTFGQNEEALSLAQRAVLDVPDDAAVHAALAYQLGAAGKAAEAAAQWLQAKLLSLPGQRDHLIACVNLALAFQRLGRKQEARKAYDECLFYKRLEFVSTLEPLTVVMTNLGEPEKSLDLCDWILARQPRLAAVWNNRAIALRRMGRIHEALRSATQATEINPRYEKAWSNKATALQELGKYDEALSAAEHALQINPFVIGAIAIVANALCCLGHAEEALRRLQAIIPELPQPPAPILTCLAMAYGDLHRFDEANAALDVAATVDPSCWGIEHLRDRIRRMAAGST
jgi:tetratricopeptide (TPR) repeat protein